MNFVEKHQHMDIKFIKNCNDIFQITSNDKDLLIAGIVSEDQFRYLYNEDAIYYEERLQKI